MPPADLNDASALVARSTTASQPWPNPTTSNRVARLHGSFHRVQQHHQRMRRAGFAAYRIEVVAHGVGGIPRPALAMPATARPIVLGMTKCETVEALTPAFCSTFAITGGTIFDETFVADPALFPRVVELFAGGAKVIDEVDRCRMRGNEFEQRFESLPIVTAAAPSP